MRPGFDSRTAHAFWPCRAEQKMCLAFCRAGRDSYPHATYLIKRLDHRVSTECQYVYSRALLAERSKALRSGRSIFGCVGSNPTECNEPKYIILPEVGFEPTHPEITELKSAALDRSAIQAWLCIASKKIFCIATPVRFELTRVEPIRFLI